MAQRSISGGFRCEASEAASRREGASPREGQGGRTAVVLVYVEDAAAAGRQSGWSAPVGASPEGWGECFLAHCAIGSRPKCAQRRSAMTGAGGKHLQRHAPSALHDLPRRGRSQGAEGTPRPCSEIRRVFLRLSSSLVRRPSHFPANPNSQMIHSVIPAQAGIHTLEGLHAS